MSTILDAGNVPRPPEETTTAGEMTSKVFEAFLRGWDQPPPTLEESLAWLRRRRAAREQREPVEGER